MWISPFTEWTINLQQMRFHMRLRFWCLLPIAIAGIPRGFWIDSDAVTFQVLCARVVIRWKNSRFNFHLRKISWSNTCFQHMTPAFIFIKKKHWQALKKIRTSQLYAKRNQNIRQLTRERFSSRVGASFYAFSSTLQGGVEELWRFDNKGWKLEFFSV